MWRETKILLIDDNAARRHELAIILSFLGEEHLACTSQDWRSAVAGLESSREVLSVLLGDVEAKGGALELTKQLAGWDEFLPLLTVGDVSIAISANIVTDSNGSRLVLSSETTGEGTDLHVSGTGDLAALDINNTFDEDGKRVLSKQSGTDAGYITPSSNASYTLDGLELSSSTNTVTALSGLTIKLTGEGSSTLTVGANTEGLKTSVESFVTAYNTLITVTNALTKVSATDDGSSTEAGAMVGDASVRSLLTSIRSALSDTSGASGNLNVLAQLGVTTNKDGTLAIDDAKLTSSLESNYADVKEFFAGSNGLLSRLGDVTSAYTASGGLLDTREKNIQSTLNDLASQQEALDRRIESVTASLYTKYNNMDTLVAQLQATSESILATLNALNEKDS